MNGRTECYGPPARENDKQNLKDRMPETGAASGVHHLRRDMGIWSAVSLWSAPSSAAASSIVPKTMILQDVGSPYLVLAVWVLAASSRSPAH